jgi:hypothetical protein
MERIEILRSAVIPTEGFVHGFPTRAGGVSTGKRASLNLGTRWATTRRRCTRTGGGSPRPAASTWRACR